LFGGGWLKLQRKTAGQDSGGFKIVAGSSCSSRENVTARMMTLYGGPYAGAGKGRVKEVRRRREAPASDLKEIFVCQGLIRVSICVGSTPLRDRALYEVLALFPLVIDQRRFVRGVELIQACVEADAVSFVEFLPSSGRGCSAAANAYGPFLFRLSAAGLQ
jgi:hypothetical protein